MTRFTEFSSLVRKLQCTNLHTQCAVLKEVVAALQDANKSDLQELLELLISTHDVEIQIKLFSVLSAYLINYGLNYEIIVKFNPLYETIQNLLVRGLPMKAAVGLNFVMALLTCDNGDTQSLATHARNMIRVSGCLNTMSEMFSGSMMYQDTWIALCQSLAEACRGSEINQNYCSHLVPLVSFLHQQFQQCVQRCRQGNVDVCSVLQSLLLNHERNLQLFIDSKGLDIFTRQLLQYNMGMQLLNTIVEKSLVAASMLRSTDVVYHLRDFLRLYGPYSQMGQWGTIILYHLDKGEKNIMETSSSLRNITALRQNQAKIVTNMAEGLSKPRNNACNIDTVQEGTPQAGEMNENTISLTEHNSNNNNNHMPKQDDTTSLFQNVIKEVLYWKSKENQNSSKKFQFNIANQFNCKPSDQSQPPDRKFKKCNATKPSIRKTIHEKDLTFSFLIQDALQNTPKQHNDKIIESDLNPSYKTNITSYDKGVQTNDILLSNSGFYKETMIDLRNFKPPFISTPKNNSNKANQTNISKITHRSKASTTCKRKQVNKLQTRRLDSKKQEIRPNASQGTKYRSMSERFFSAINESCTTIVKSMKSIFTSKQYKDENKMDEKEVENTSCSYSFTNYMRRRDALLESDFSRNVDSSSENYKVNSCKTCKDTIVLQQKMKRDDHLKQTVRKIKMGINLYGCDFKKISHAMWPRDRYMTPDLLYNLYRKLIVKGGHENHSFRQKAHKLLRRS